MRLELKVDPESERRARVGLARSSLDMERICAGAVHSGLLGASAAQLGAEIEHGPTADADGLLVEVGVSSVDESRARSLAADLGLSEGQERALYHAAMRWGLRSLVPDAGEPGQPAPPPRPWRVGGVRVGVAP